MTDPQNVHRVGVVVNPTAGLGKGARVGKRVMSEFESYNVHIVDLSGATATDAQAKARAACLEGLAALIVVGGDGMVNLGVNAVVNTPTPLGIIAAGSGNDFARALKLPVNDVKASVAHIMRAIQEHSVQHLDVGLVEPYVHAMSHTRVLKASHEMNAAHVTGSRRWFAGTLSLGLDAAVNAQANTYSWPTGHLKYLRAVLACLAKFRPYGYAITINGVRSEKLGTLAAVSNSPMFGGGIPIAPHASLTDGKLNFIYAKPLSIGGILKVFPKLYKGTHLTDPAVHTEEVTEILLEPSGHGAFPPVAMADGEVVGTVPLRVTVQPGLLSLLA